MEYLFWISLFIVAYSFLGYGLLISLMPQKKQDYPLTSIDVTLLLPVYNEHSILADKLENSLALNYPKDLFKILIVTDGSDGKTIEIAQAYAQQYPLQITHLHEDKRNGKLGAVKRAMGFVDTAITVFSDCNTDLNSEALLALVAPFSDPKVGITAGEKKVFDTTKSIQEAEGLYWKIESWVKKQETGFGNVMGVAGELFALRTPLYPNLPADTILEDLSITLSTLNQGYKAVYVPSATATEAPSPTVKDEYERKVRIAAGGYQCLIRYSYLLNPFKFPKISFQLFSHRILRYFFIPILLPLLLFTNICLFPELRVMLGLQIGFYLCALIGYQYARGNQKAPSIFKIPFFFCMMHAALYHGFWNFLKGDLPTVWKKNRQD